MINGNGDGLSIMHGVRSCGVQRLAEFHEHTRGRYRPLFRLISRITTRITK